MAQNINLENVVDMWKAARRSEEKEAVLRYIFVSYTQNPDEEIPGFKDTPDLVDSFTRYTFKVWPPSHFFVSFL